MAGFSSAGRVKYRHMYGKEHKKEETFYSLLPDLTSLDDPIISCSDQYWAVPYKGGGGPVYISRLTDYGKVLPECATMNGHKGPVLATSFSPFHSGLLATASADCTVKVWNLELYDDFNIEEPFSKCLSSAGDTVEPIASFTSHRNNVRTCDFHPTVPNLLATTSLDATLRFFDVTAEAEVSKLKLASSQEFNDMAGQIANLSFSYDGTMLSIACKDERVIRIIDPRAGTVVMTSDTSTGAGSNRLSMNMNRIVGRNLRVAWCGSSSTSTNVDPLVSMSSNSTGQRLLHIWDIRQGLTTPITHQTVDQQAGQLFPMFDEGLNTLFIVGKGDTILRGYEFTSLLDADATADVAEDSTNTADAPHLLSSSTSPIHTTAAKLDFEKSMDFQTAPQEPFAGMCLLPKRLCDVQNIEVAQFLKLSNDAVTPMSFRVPRAEHLKKYFHDDIFPPVRSKHSELSVEDWTSADTPTILFQPNTESLKPSMDEQGNEIVNISDKPEEEKAPSESKSKISYFNDAIVREEEEAKAREDNLQRFQKMAQENAKFHANLSGGVKKIGGVIITDNTNDDDDSDAGWSDED